MCEVSGTDAAKAERIRKTPIGRAPVPEHPFILSATNVRIVLRRAGFSDSEFMVTEGETKVSTQSQSFDLKDLVSSIRDLVVSLTGESPGDVVLEPSEVFDRSITLPKGKVTVDLKPPASGRYEGKVLFTADLRVDGRRARIVPLNCTIHIEKPRVMVIKRVERGQKLDKEHLAVKRADNGLVGRDPVDDLSMALGRTAARSLAPGQVLRMSDLVDPPVVKRGQELTCHVRRGNVEMEAQVRALEDGKAGTVIRVENTGSKKILKVRVLDENTVEAVSAPADGVKARSGL